MDQETIQTKHEQAVPVNDKRDRRGRIKAMGVFQIVLGGITSLILLIGLLGMLLSSALAESMGSEQNGIGASLASLGVYALAALFFFTAGIGSLKLRRWSRPLVLAFMWPSLIFGMLGFVFGVIFLPTVFAAMPIPEGPNLALQKEIMSAVSVVVNVILFIVCVAIPAIHLLIYQPASIRETLLRVDTTPRFTDKCPTPVFGIVISLISIGLMQLCSIFMGVALFFGVLLTGPAAAALLAAEAAVCLVLARLVFKCRPAGLLGTIAFMVYLGARNAIGFLSINFMDFLLASKAANAQSREIIETAFSNMPLGSISAAFWGIAGLSSAGYVFYVKKYFR
jgi:hypothetical protein